MRKNYSIYLLIFGLLISINTKAQLVSTFDDLTLNADTCWYGVDGSGSFSSGQATFKNNYNADWGSWSGFAYSNVTDNTTAGYMNQYSAIPGIGTMETANYGVCYAGNSDTIAFSKDFDLFGLYVTNATYAALSMKEGDAFSKKFGGETGTDPDWFLLTIQAFDANRNEAGVVEFYLADFRFENSNDDYIVEDWQMVDLTSLKGVSYLTFSLSSSDVGDWGMNTPGYFCLDDLIIKDFTDITFVVNDGTAPVEDVEIDFAGITLATDINGSVTFTSVSPTTAMEYTASKEGFISYEQSLNGFYAQNIEITLLPTSISDVNETSIQVYPNPTVNVVNINAEKEINSVSIYSLSGVRVMYELLYATSFASVNVEQLQAGAYIIEITTTKGIERKQLIKK
jgi:hypothetical protein